MCNLDFSKDGQVFGNDVTILLNYIGSSNSVSPLDFNKDKKVDAVDVEMIREYLYRTAEQTKNFRTYFDLTLDGVVNNKDVKLVADGVAANSKSLYLDIHMEDIIMDEGGLVESPVNAVDVEMIREYLYRTAEQTKNFRTYFDLTLDGVVNNKDVKLVASGVDAKSKYLYLDIHMQGSDLPTDGSRVNAVDVEMIREYLYRTAEQTKNFRTYFDLTLDGVVNNKDVKLVAEGADAKSKSLYLDIHMEGSDLPIDGSRVNAVDVEMIGEYVFDINGKDGVTDADRLLLVTTGCPQGKNCDLNGDGSFGVSDVATIQAYLRTHSNRSSTPTPAANY
jgi:hypothetical protein